MKTKKKKYIIVTISISIVIALLLVFGIVFLNCINNDVKNQKDAVLKFVNTVNRRKIGLQDGVYDIDKLNTSEMLFKPDFGWVKVHNGKFYEYALYFLDSDKDVGNKLEKGSYYINCCVQKIGDRVTCEELPSNVVVNVKDYGAKGNVSLYLQNPNDLVVDNVPEDLNLSDLQKTSLLETKAIQKAVDEVNKTGGVLYFPYGTYFVATNDFKVSYNYEIRNKKIFIINSKHPVIVELGQSTIKQYGYADSAPNYNFPDTVLFEVDSLSSVEIRNGTLIGDRREHDYSDWTASPKKDSHEFGYGIRFMNTQNGTARNLNIKEFTGDAIIIKNGEIAKSTGQTYKTTIINCDLSYCRRQGISVLDSDINIIRNCSIHHIGNSDIFVGDAKKGTAPMCGIDVEPASGTKSVTLVDITKSSMINCSNFGIVSAGQYVGSVNIIIDGCTVERPSVPNLKVSNSTISITDYFSVTSNASALSGGEFNNITFKFVNLNQYYLFFTNGIFNSCEFISNHLIVDGVESNLSIDFVVKDTAANYDKVGKINNISFTNIKGFYYYANNGVKLFRHGVQVNGREFEEVLFENSSAYFVDSIFNSGQFMNTAVVMPNQGTTRGVLFKAILFSCANITIKEAAIVTFESCIFDRCIEKITKPSTVIYENCVWIPEKIEGFVHKRSYFKREKDIFEFLINY